MSKYRPRFLGVALVLLSAFGLASSSRADTGTVRVVFTKGGFIVGVGGGHGVLTFHGQHYPSGCRERVWAHDRCLDDQLVGTALNLRGPRDIPVPTARSVPGVHWRPAPAASAAEPNGVILHLAGAKVGVELSVGRGRRDHHDGMSTGNNGTVRGVARIVRRPD